MSHENESTNVPVPEVEETSVKSILNQLIEESSKLQTRTNRVRSYSMSLSHLINLMKVMNRLE